jgi:hypothetical protein
MAAMSVSNRSKGWLVLWIEPLGEDRWLKPGETAQIRTDRVGEDRAFTVDFWVDEHDHVAGIENIAVLVDGGDWHVTGSAGEILECGHQRPNEEMRKRMANQPIADKT